MSLSFIRVVLLDCRAQDEFNMSRMPGAINLDPGINDTDLDSFLQSCNLESHNDHNSLFLLYSTVGERAAQLTDRIIRSFIIGSGDIVVDYFQIIFL